MAPGEGETRGGASKRRLCRPAGAEVVSPSPHGDCRFSTMSTRALPSRSAAARWAARASSSSICSRHRPLRSACVARSCRSSGWLAAHSLARWNGVSSQQSARLKSSWFSSMNRTGNSVSGKRSLGAQFRGDARQQHGFPSATRRQSGCAGSRADALLSHPLIQHHLDCGERRQHSHVPAV